MSQQGNLRLKDFFDSAALNMSSQSPIIANESGSRMKESLSSTEEQRTGIELDSLPLDGQPVSISQIHLEHVSSEETDE